MKTTSKPNLDELFQSKKLDVPSDEFWDDFQDKVKEKALSTVVQNGSHSPASKFLLAGIPSIAACVLAYFFILQTSPPSISDPVHLPAGSVDASVDSLVLVSSEIQVVENLELVSSVLNDLDNKGFLNAVEKGQESLQLVADHDLYVQQALKWADEDSSFEKHTIEEDETPLGDFAQFTF